MKKQFLALSLVLSAGLYAETQMTNDTNSSNCMPTCETCQCVPCRCEPCCIPKPKKCIDCTCYNPMFYDLQCDCGYFGTVEFLYWYARETNLSYGLKIIGTAKDINSNTSDVLFGAKKYLNLSTEWDPGFRVGIGYNYGCDGWDYYLNWTYMHNSASDTEDLNANFALNGVSLFLPDVDQEGLLNPWVNPGVFPTLGASPTNLQPIVFDKIAAKWKMTINWADLELGRKFWTSQCFNIRPYVGLRGLWDEVSFRTQSTRTSSLPANAGASPLVFNDRFINRLWGVGMTCGFQPAWYFCQSFALYGNMDISLLWGELSIEKKEKYQDSSGISGEIINWISSSSKNNFFQMTSMLDLAIGWRWETTWCCDQYRSALDVGWENHVLFDQNHRGKLIDFFASQGASSIRQGSGFRTFDEATGNLILGGLVVRARLDF